MLVDVMEREAPKKGRIAPLAFAGGVYFFYGQECRRREARLQSFVLS